MPDKVMYIGEGGTVSYLTPDGRVATRSFDEPTEDLEEQGYKPVGKDQWRAALPVAGAQKGAWNLERDWARGGAAMRAAEAHPRAAALQRLGGLGEATADPDTGEFAASPTGAWQNGRIRIPMSEYRTMLSAEDSVQQQEAADNAKRDALMDLERRTRVPAPAAKTAPRHPQVSVSTVVSGGTPRPFQDLASLAPGVADVTGGNAPARTASARPTAKEAPSTPIADGLAREQFLATLSRLGSGISSGGARIAEAISGAKATPGAYDNTAAEQRVKDYMLRQGTAKQEAEDAKKAAAEAALKDPFSAESMRFKAALQRFMPTGYTPKELEQITAADAPMVTDFAKMRSTLDARSKEAEAERTSREQIAADNRTARSEDARQRSLDRALSRELAAQQHKDVAAAREDAKQQDFERKMTERNVGGYEIDPANPPTAEGAKNMANVVRHRDEILGSLDRLEAEIKANGSEMFGTKAGEMASEWMNITNRLRGLNEMGVPNGKDYEMLAKQLVDPTSWDANNTSTARMLQQIKSLRSQMDRTTEATAKAYKFKPTIQGGAPTSQATATPRRKKDAQGQVWGGATGRIR
jgi:hypothetical protein